MQSTADTKRDYENLNQLSLIACLALYQHRQDKAVGIDWLSGQTKGLLWYYNSLQQKQVEKLSHMAYYNGIIQQANSEIKMLVARAEKAKNKQKILMRAQALKGIIVAAKKKIDDIEKVEQ